MRFDTGEYFAYATNSAASTCSFALTASTRNILIESIQAYSDGAAGQITIQASGTTIWAMKCGSAGTAMNFTGLSIDCANAQTISGNITGSGQADIAICGRMRKL